MNLLSKLAGVIVAANLLLPLAWTAQSDRPGLLLVLVVDGLRPDSITADVMPNLSSLKKQGVWYEHAHSVYPTVTRVNASSIVTGTLPSTHGIVSNSLYVPAVAPRLLNTGDYRDLLKLAAAQGGRIIAPATIGELLSKRGIRYVAVSSGSTGSALLLNHLAPSGAGSLINPDFEDGKRVAFPDALNSELLRRFGTAGGSKNDSSLIWTERVLREYVLTQLHPQVVIDWLTQPDGAQHAHGVGSPEALAALKLVDQQIGYLLDHLKKSGQAANTDIIVTCDHGFDYEPAEDILTPVIGHNFAPGDVVVDNEGGGSLLYVKDHDPEKIRRLVQGFQKSASVNVIFAAATPPAGGSFRCKPGATQGWLPGTLALELASQCMPAHGPDLIVTYHWDDTKGPFGAPGTQLIPGRQAHNGHGALNPWTVRSTLLLVGPHFAQGQTVDIPAGNQDIAPTILTLQGLTPPESMQGRVLSEAFRDQTKRPSMPNPVTRRIAVSAGAYCGEVEISSVGKKNYLNYGKRCAAPAAGSR